MWSFVLDFFHLAYVFKIHPCCSTRKTPSFIWPNVAVPRLFFCSPGDGQLDCFHLLAIVNNVMNICVQVFSWTYIFVFLGYLPRSGNC